MRLPAGTARRTFTLASPAGTDKATLRVLGGLDIPLTVSDRTPRHGTRQYVVARGLAAGEKVTVSYRGDVVARGKASSTGRFRGYFRAGPAGTADAQGHRPVPVDPQRDDHPPGRVTPVSLGMRLLAALALVASGLVLQSQVPAVAAGCTGSTGVTVVVDHHQLGGGVQQACDADGGGKAASTVFPDSGFPLTYVQRQPGFVCRVAGAPASDPCVNTPPASAYWSLWWSDGKSGTWTYSSTGVGSLKVPDGGYVAFSWQGQDGKAAPGRHPDPARRLLVSVTVAERGGLRRR